MQNKTPDATAKKTPDPAVKKPAVIGTATGTATKATPDATKATKSTKGGKAPKK